MLDRFVRSLTSTGRAVLFAGPIGLILAVISGWREFFVVGVGCLLALFVGTAWIAFPQKIGVKRTLYPSRVTVGQSSTGVVQVTNTTRRRVGQRFAEDVLGDEVVRMTLPPLSRGESVEQPYLVPARKRGLFEVGPVRLTRTDPLGLFRLVQGQGSVEQLWVRPVVHSFATISSGWAKDLDGPTSDTAPRGSAAFHALREYQQGDDLRHVHWRTSARRSDQKLMVRHFVDTRRSQETVLLDPRSEYYTEDSFEEAIEIVASIASAAQAAGHSVRMVLSGQSDLAKDERLSLLDRLALVTPRNGYSLPEVFAEAHYGGRGSSALVIVTGSSDGDVLIQQARRIQRQGLVIVVRVAGDVTRPSVVSSGGGRVVTVANAKDAAGAWLEAVRQR